MSWRNERALYHRNDAFDKELISIYSPETKAVVYERDYWWSDKWDPLQSGRAYDFAKPFFVQYQELLQSTPLPNIFANTVVNSPYTNHVGYLKNCYLVFASCECENVLYGEKIIRTKDTVDSYGGAENELCYEVVDCEKSHRLSFSRDCGSCIDSAFLYDCRNCSSCFGCMSLRNKEYHILNKPYSKEEYIARIKEYTSGSYRALQQFSDQFQELRLRRPHRFAHFTNTVNVVGNHCSNMKNCYSCFDLIDVEESKYIYYGGLGLKDSYDGYGVGVATELLYEGVDTGASGSREKFSVVVYTCRDADYCFNQYTKEEYEALVPKIIQHMNDMPWVDQQGRVYKYGEFFPSELSPFSYNETIAQEYFPLTKEEALGKGYHWRDPETKHYTVTKKPDNPPDHITEVENTILNETVGCAHAPNGQATCNDQCTTAFKIIPDEIAFYRRMNLPLPRLCPNCRYYARLKQRNPLKLWHRKCLCGGKIRDEKLGTTAMYENTATHLHGAESCPNEFETSYAPERPEIVYCESCYNSEVV